MTTDNPWNRATFVLGTDSQHPFIGKRALRIDGVYIEQQPDLEPARAGLWLWDTPIPLAVGLPYVVSFVYRTDQVRDSGAAVYLYFDDPELATRQFGFRPISRRKGR